MQVTRQRRTAHAGRPNRRSRGSSRRHRAIVLSGAGVAYGSTTQFAHHQVGTQYKDGLQVSDDQVLAPLGDRLATKFGKFMASTPSADGHYLAVTSTDKSVVLQVFDLQTYRLVYTVGSATFANQKITDGTVGQGGPAWSPDGKALWLPQANGLTRFPVHADGTLGTPMTVTLPTVERRRAAAGQVRVLPRWQDPLRPGQRTEHRRRARPRHRHGAADLERRHRPA